MASIWAPGNSIQVGTDNTVIPQQFTATAAQTLFTLTLFTYTPGTNSILVYVNGVLQVSGVDYTESSTSTITFTTGLKVGDRISVIGLTAIEGTGVNTGPNFADNETPAGVISGTNGVDGNAVFTLANTPIAASIQLTKTDVGTGVEMVQGVHYNIAGSIITYTSGNIPIVGQTHRIWYRY